MKVLILGAGMYVTGRNNTGVGTVLSSLIQASKKKLIDEIIIVAKNKDNCQIVELASQEINQKLNTNIAVNYISLNEMSLNEVCKVHRVHCAIISTPDHLHYEQIKQLLELKIHVLSVKPLVANIEENKELIALQKKNYVLGMVEFHKRYDEANLYTKKILKEGKLGNILYYDVDYSQRLNIPENTFKKWVTHTNIFQYLGIHYVDLFYFLTGYIPIKVVAYGTDGILKQKNINTYDSIHVSIVWKGADNNECLTVFNTNWIDPNCTSALSDQKYKIVGTLGRIENNHKNRGLELVTNSTQIQHPNPYFSEYLYDANGHLEFNGYAYKSIRQFIDDVDSVLTQKNKVEDFEGNRPTFTQTLISTSVISAVNQSLSNASSWENISVTV